MPILDDTWNEEDYSFSQRTNLKSLPRNHLEKLKALKFDFIEYKANQYVACHIYERMMVHCYNKFGLGLESMKPECIDAKRFFFHCLMQNNSLGLQKRYFPEFFLGNPYSRPSPNVSDII